MKGAEVWGSVKCIYCKEFKQVYFDESYFVVSNMNRHLNSCAKKYNSNTETLSTATSSNQQKNIGSHQQEIIDSNQQKKSIRSYKKTMNPSIIH